MANLVEVVVTTDTKNTLWTCSIWDPDTGTNLMTYKNGGVAEAKSLNFIGDDYLCVAEKSYPLLHIWQLNSQEPVRGMRFVLPGKASTVAFTKDGAYCIAGIEDQIYIWHMFSDTLFTILKRHYQRIVQLKFSDDDKFFVSSSEDGAVMVWTLATVVALSEVSLVTQKVAGQHDPLHIFHDHSQRVTDFCISKMGVKAKLVTVSVDKTCKIYDLTSGEVLLSVIFDKQLYSVTFDVLELNVFIGSSSGEIHQINLTSPYRQREIMADGMNSYPKFIGHSKGVTGLSVSMKGQTLLSSSNDECVILWDIPSQQPIKMIKHKGSITNACFKVNKPAIYKQNHTPKITLHNLSKTLVDQQDEQFEIDMVTHKNNFLDEILAANSDGAASVVYDDDHMQEMNRMKMEIARLQRINHDIFSYSMQRATEYLTKKKK